MSRQAIKLDKTYAFPSRFIQLCSQEQKTLDDWGNTFDVTRQTITNWQLGESAPNIIALTKIAEYFVVSTDYLLGLSDTRNPDVSARAAVAYTGLSEKAVERLHIGLGDFESDGVGISDYDKAVNLRIASELICSEEFSQMIYRLGLMAEAAYDEGILRILEAEHSGDALTDTDEFVFANPEDRAVTIKAIEHMLSVHGESNALTEKVEDLSKMSDDELSDIVISELISRRDSNELQQFHAAKTLGRFIDDLLNQSKAKGAATFQHIQNNLSQL